MMSTILHEHIRTLSHIQTGSIKGYWKHKQKIKNLMQNFHANVNGRMHTQTDKRTDGITDERTERQKLYTPRHTSYVGGIKTLTQLLYKFLSLRP